MILLALILGILVGSKDACTLKFNAWSDSNQNKFSKNELSDFFWYATTRECNYSFDSLPNRVRLKKSKDSVIAKNNDTIVDWKLWVHNNSDKYTQEEIDELRFRSSRDMRSKRFYQYVEGLNDYKQERAEKLKRRSFAHVATSISNSDSIVFVDVNDECEWQGAKNSSAQRETTCTKCFAKYGIYCDITKSLHAHDKIKRIGKMFFDEIVKNDSTQIYEKRHNIGRLAFGCGWSLDAVLIIYYDDAIFRINFDETNKQMYFKDEGDSQSIYEKYSDEFYNRLQKYIGVYQRKSSGCGG